MGGSAIERPISVVNSADDSDFSTKCRADIEAEVRSELRVMGYARWQELCSIEEKARERTQIDPGMPVKADK